MKTLIRNQARPAVIKRLFSVVLLGAALAGCDGEKGPDDGAVINNIVLPTDGVIKASAICISFLLVSSPLVASNARR